MSSQLPFNFGGLPDVPLKKARFVILPIPYEATASYQVGAKFGPEGVILASRNMELYDEELQTEPCQAGIKTAPALEAEHQGPEKMVTKIAKTAFPLINKDKFLIGLGGEHSVSIGLVRAFGSKFPDLKILHLDAHADLRDTYEGTRFSHACAVRRMLETGFSVYSFGIRSISKEEIEFVKKEKPRVEITWAYEMKEHWPKVLADKLPAGRYYLSLDLDFFDPSIVPDTGTPEPGGFFWYETLEFLKNFIRRKDTKVLGFDVVELAPKNFFSPSCFFTARLIYKLIGYLC